MIELVRIDDRLIHGQIVLGWGVAIRPERIILADDRVASDEFERELYAKAWPEVKVSILSVATAAEQIKKGIFESERLMIVVRDPTSALKLLDLGVAVETINVGGMHFREGREKLAEGVYADSSERALLRELAKRGIELDGRELPSSPSIILNSVLA